ncbi:glycine oxidase ThiO [Synechococcus sp. PCC 7336]|uniref:glycine oxidase ThiO n=1 Tax=Synechococcus sp. PCC 7336 TaxID=195250 RepID=UPI00034A0F56|nr:glycine oxidase ThiO [Synechococcus sp. PCC 7336]
MPRWDVLVVGGGAIGMAIAFELALAGRQVAIADRDRFGRQASWAAAGMLAPRAEALPLGPMLDLCLHSLALYADWSAKLEQISGIDTGYWPCGILLPQAQPPLNGPAPDWLTRDALDRRQPGLGDRICGATWLPQEGQVDNRQLVQSLRAALLQVGVTALAHAEVEDWIVEGDRVAAVQTPRGRLEADIFVAAAGAFSGQLLPLPVRPLKGQMLQVFDPKRRLQHILFGEGIYIVPRRDGRIAIGATMEEVGFEPGNTAGGIQQLLNDAIALFPPVAEMPLQAQWWGYRPATPDELPILGRGPQQNLYLATGHHRNGILLTPATAEAIAQLVLTGVSHRPLEPFSWRRFASSPAASLC